jgi:hypothetical protein
LTFARTYVLVLFMIDTLLPNDGSEDPAAFDAAAARALRQERVLKELAEIGMAMARALRDRVLAGGVDDAALCELSLAFTRVAKAVRMSLALATRLDGEREARGARRAAEALQARAAAAAAREARGEETIERVRDAVGTAIGVQTTDIDDDGDESERLCDGLEEYLDDPRETDAFADLPVSVAVARVCKALGMPVDWELWKDEDCAVEEWRAATPGSPYAPAADGASRDGVSRAAPGEYPPEDGGAAPDSDAGVRTRGPPVRRLS